jgi:hypothetical protein
LDNFITVDSGARESFDTGMVRDTRSGKGRFDLQSPIALRRRCQLYERGAEKYEARNWEKGSPLSRFCDSAMRHINDYLMVALYKREGIDLALLPPDVNPNEDHLAAATWNLDCMMHHEVLHPEFDDLSVKAKAKPQPNAGLALVGGSLVIKAA